MKIISWSGVSLENLIISQLYNKIAAFYGFRWFIAISLYPVTGPYSESDTCNQRP
jgi:hypothetical protein